MNKKIILISISILALSFLVILFVIQKEQSPIVLKQEKITQLEQEKIIPPKQEVAATEENTVTSSQPTAIEEESIKGPSLN